MWTPIKNCCDVTASSSIPLAPVQLTAPKAQREGGTEDIDTHLCRLVTHAAIMKFPVGVERAFHSAGTAD